LPSSPTLGRSETVANAAAGRPAIPRRPSLSFAGQVPPLPSIPKSTPLRRPDVADPPKSSILKSRASPYTHKQSPPDAGRSAESTSTSRRQRRVTLSNSPGASSGTQAQDPEVNLKRVPSVPKLPRRLSIPMLRRKQSQSVVQDGENEG